MASDNPTGRTRSPAYPSINLKKALDRLRDLYKHERRNAVHVDIALSHWGYDPKSSNGLRSVAALKQFGLIVEQGKNDDRQVRLSDAGLALLLTEGDGGSEFQELLQKAALAPTLHKDVWTHYKGELPSDGALQRYLIVSKNFNDSFVARFIGQFRSTIAFAKLSSDDTIYSDDDTAGVGEEGENVVTGHQSRSQNSENEPRNAGFSLPKSPAGTREFPLYTSGARGALYVPDRMSTSDFLLIKQQIQNSLAVIEATSVEGKSEVI